MMPETQKVEHGAVARFVFGQRYEVRTVAIGDDVWFVGRDVAEALGYTNPSKAMNDHCKGVTKRYPLQTAGGAQDFRVLSEPDVLRLIVKSELPAAERFERWVFEDVLPSIRRTGTYALSAKHPTSLPDFSNPAVAARAWAEQYEARQLAERTKTEIGSRREASAMATASAAVRKASRLEAELGRSTEYATVKRMEMLYHGQRFNWRRLKSTAAEIGVPAIDVFDATHGTVKAYHADVWREAYALEIESAEVC